MNNYCDVTVRGHKKIKSIHDYIWSGRSLVDSFSCSRYVLERKSLNKTIVLNKDTQNIVYCFTPEMASMEVYLQ